MILVPLFTPSAYAADVKSGDTFGDWLADCPKTADGKTLPCRMVQVQNNKLANGKTVKIIKTAIIPLSKGRKLFLGHLPLGYFVLGGVALSIDEGEPTQMALQRCIPQGCETAAEITPQLEAALRKGKAGKIRFRLGQKHAYLPFSLTGISKALDAMK